MGSYMSPDMEKVAGTAGMPAEPSSQEWGTPFDGWQVKWGQNELRLPSKNVVSSYKAAWQGIEASKSKAAPQAEGASEDEAASQTRAASQTEAAPQAEVATQAEAA